MALLDISPTEIFTCTKDACTKFIATPSDYNGISVLRNTTQPLQSN